MANSEETAEYSLSLEEELTCPVCLELYREPVSLPCLHSVCMTCIEKMHKTNVQNNVRLNCPLCQKLILLPNGSVNELPKNFQLNNIVKKFQEHQGRKAEQQPEKNEERKQIRHTHDMQHRKTDIDGTFKEELPTTQSSVNVDVPGGNVWWPMHRPRRWHRGHHPPLRFCHQPPPPGHHPPPPGHHPPPPGHHPPPAGHHPPPPGEHPPLWGHRRFHHHPNFRGCHRRGRRGGFM